MPFSIPQLTIALAIGALVISFAAAIDDQLLWCAYFAFYGLEKFISIHKENINRSRK